MARLMAEQVIHGREPIEAVERYQTSSMLSRNRSLQVGFSSSLISLCKGILSPYHGSDLDGSMLLSECSLSVGM